MGVGVRTLLLSPLGEWRATFLWWFLGLAIYEYVLLLGGNVYGGGVFFAYGLQYALPAAVLLMLFGSRLLPLAAAAGLTIAASIPLVFRVVEWQIGEELLLFTSLPVAGALLVLVAARQQPRAADSSGSPESVAALRRRVDASHVALFRIAAIVTLTFAALHKLNHDFFDTDVSCASVLASELNAWWTLPLTSLTSLVRPIDVVLAEAAIAALLLTYPRLGIFVCALVIGIIGHRGATAFSILTFVVACAFLYERDAATLQQGLRRHWRGLVVVILVTAPFSAKYFNPVRLWYEFHLFQVVILLVAAGSAYLMVRDWRDALREPGDRRRRAVAELLVPRRRDDAFARVAPAGKAVLVVYALLSVLNGMSPYLGLKYRLSFAMLSNLRVDDARWNSMIFPHWLYLRAHDPFVHVHDVEFDARGEDLMEGLERKPTRGLYPGLFSPMSFKYRMKFVVFNATSLDIDFSYQGRDYSFRDALHDDEFNTLVANLPDGKMFQEGLTESGPQSCTH